MSTSGVCMYGHAETVCSGCGTVFPAGVASAGAVCFCGQPLQADHADIVESVLVQIWSPLWCSENGLLWGRTSERLFGVALAFRAVGWHEAARSASWLGQVALVGQDLAWEAFRADVEVAEHSWSALPWRLRLPMVWRRLVFRVSSSRKGGLFNQQVPF